MFNKKNNKTNSDSVYLESVKFHTMKDDATGEVRNVPLKEDEATMEKVYINKGGSPFLNNAVSLSGENPPKSEPNPEIATQSSDISKEEQAEPKSNMSSDYPHMADSQNSDFIENNVEREELGEKKSIFVYVAIFIIILLLGSGGYYFLVMKAEEYSGNMGSETPADLNEGNDPSGTDITDGFGNITNDPSNNTSKFSDKVNFMVVKDEELNQEGVTKLIKNKFIEMEKYNGNQLEFLMVDTNNKPILFKNFIDNFKISLSQSITDNLATDNFSIFLYKNGGIKRVNVVVGVKDVSVLKINLKREESLLVGNLNSLFVYDKPESDSVKQFNQSEYNGTSIRYINLNKDVSLSVDYFVSGDYLVFATNKDCGRLIVDKIASESVIKKDVFNAEN